MSEEEKKAIEYWKRDIEFYHCNTQLASEHYAQIILNLIEKQQKELNNIKEIEKSHQEENGKLRVELEQYKLLEANIDKANKIIAENKFDEGLYGLLMKEEEKNKELEEKLKIATAMLTKGTYPEQNEGDNDFDKKFIAVDKIKQKIEEVQARMGNDCIALHDFQREAKIDVLKELLEEK